MSAKKQFHREYPEDTKRISRDYKKNTICMKGWSLMCPSKNSEEYVKGINPKIEAYLGLRKYLLRTFGVTLNIHSQKTKGSSDKNTAITQK